MTTVRTFCLLGLGLAAGCGSPLHLTYDYGRSYSETFIAQADLTRPSIQSSRYRLYGVEAAQIRIRVQEASTDEEQSSSSLDL